MGTRGAVRVFPLAFARASERANRASSAAILSSSDSAPEVSFSRKSRTSALMEVPRLAARTRALEWISSSIFKVIFFMTVLHSNCAIVNRQGGCSSALLCSSSSCHLRSPESSPGESKSKLPWLKSMMGETLNSRFQTPRKKGWIPWAGCPGDGLGLESPATVDQTPRRGSYGKEASEDRGYSMSMPIFLARSSQRLRACCWRSGCLSVSSTISMPKMVSMISSSVTRPMVVPNSLVTSMI